MARVSMRELRNHTRRVLERVEAGEDITITVDGRPIAWLTPVPHKPRWVRRDVLLRQLPSIQADAALSQELKSLAPDRADDLDQL